MVTISKLTAASDANLAELDALSKELHGEGWDGLAANREDVDALIKNENAACMVARDGDRIVGMATLYVIQKIGKRTSSVEDVVVLGEYRGQGLGEQLMRAIIEEARARGVRSINLTSRPTRVAAHRLYEKLGFIKRETDPFTLRL